MRSDEAVEVLKKLGLCSRDIDVASKRWLCILDHQVSERGEKSLSLGDLVVGAHVSISILGLDVVDEWLEATGIEVHEQRAIQIFRGDPLGFARNDAEADTLIR